ncbi:MAG: MaoC family dehydratase [Rhodobiaceae bacterium]|jgi:acyl dehydratase|nr:MaoC family dehydratase [Rhodobiaceae bacterium]MBT7280081.1 MaoC family dehydratase [Rhodobiaceae bacterium]MDG2495587.1 MaoC family dehydratase [Alphaproteobacteria bacterium]
MRVFENLEEYAAAVGEELGVSDWVQIDQDQVNLFADATGDHQWIHLDTERTQKELGMGTIVHGFLTLSLLPVLMAQISGVKSVTRGINYGSNKTRFVSMVPVGSKLRARSTLKSAEPKAGGMLFTSEVTVEIEGSEMPALVSENLTLLFQ